MSGSSLFSAFFFRDGRRPVVLFLLAAALVLCPACKKDRDPSPGGEVVVWTYDSFNSGWGPGPDAGRLFLERSGITVRWVNHGDAGELLARLLREGEDAEADVVLGLDQNMAGRALASGLFAAYAPAGHERILPELALDGDFRLVPFDYSYFAIVYDSELVAFPPRSLEDLTRPEFEMSLVVMDPRTSSPGLGFLGWTMEVYGEGWRDYWRRLMPSLRTVADGWSAGYGIFAAGDADMVLSYTTSPGYHLENEGSDRFRAAIFPQGHPMQIEAAGLLAAARNPDNAKKFLDFMLDDAFQSLIPLTNWMYPVTPVPLPGSFRINPKSERTLRPAPPSEEDLRQWNALFQNW